MEVQSIKADYSFTSDEIAAIAKEISDRKDQIESKVTEFKVKQQRHKAEVSEIEAEIEHDWDKIRGGVELRTYDCVKVIDEKNKKIVFFEVVNNKKTKTVIKEFPFPNEGYQAQIGDDFDINNYDPFSDFETEEE